MPKFEVLVTAFRSVIVKAKSAEQAQEIAANECTSFDWSIDEWKTESKLKNATDVERAKRNGAVELENW